MHEEADDLVDATKKNQLDQIRALKALRQHKLDQADRQLQREQVKRRDLESQVKTTKTQLSDIFLSDESTRKLLRDHFMGKHQDGVELKTWVRADNILLQRTQHAAAMVDQGLVELSRARLREAEFKQRQQLQLRKHEKSDLMLDLLQELNP